MPHHPPRFPLKKQTKLFVLTEKGKVYASNTNGASFVLVNPQLKGTGGDMDVARVLTSRTDSATGHVQSEHLILQGCQLEADASGYQRCTSKYHWASRDLGDTWIQPCGLEDTGAECFKSPSTIAGGHIEGSFHMNPHNPEQVLVRVTRKSCDDRDFVTSADGSCGHDLFYSPDFGKSWVNLVDNSQHRVVSFLDFNWAPDQVDGKPGIMATVYEDLEHLKQRAGYNWDYNVHFVYSTDLFGSAHQTLMRCGNVFQTLGKDVYVAKNADCEAFHGASEDERDGFVGGQVELQLSIDGGKNFARACFPVSVADNGYTIFDYRDDVSGPDFIVVDHDEEDEVARAAPIGNIYSSDKSGQLYSLSMRRALYLGGAVDFTNVEGIPGIYFANQVASGALGDPAEFIQTRISYNNGGAWQPLVPPSVDATRKPIVCAGVCQLHLHGASSWDVGTWETRLGSVYSQRNAPGVVIATGNVANALSFDPRVVNTYLSRDSGASWDEILQGPHIYEFGNKGGLIVAAKMSSLGPANKIQFSKDEGETWTDLPLAREMNVHNIRVDPVGDGLVFLVHGTDSVEVSGDGDPDGVVYTIDFASLKDSNNAYVLHFTKSLRLLPIQD